MQKPSRPLLGEAELYQAVHDEVSELLRDDELTRPLAEQEIALLQAVAECFAQGLPAVTTFVALSPLRSMAKATKPKEKRPAALLASIASLRESLRPEELKNADLAGVVHAILDRELPDEVLAGIIDRELGIECEGRPDYLHRTLMVLHVVEMSFDSRIDLKTYEAVTASLQTALAVDRSAKPADLVRDTCKQALAALHDRQLTKPLSRHELLFARGFVRSLLQGVDPRQVWSLLHVDDCDLKPDRRLPQELSNRLTEMTHGVGLIMGGEQEFAAIASITHLAASLAFKVPKKHYQRATRILETLQAREMASRN